MDGGRCPPCELEKHAQVVMLRYAEASASLVNRCQILRGVPLRMTLLQGDSTKRWRRILGAIAVAIWIAGMTCAPINAATAATTQGAVATTSPAPATSPIFFAKAARDVTD